MSVRLSSEENLVALIDSTVGIAFGPVFNTEDEANAFLDHLGLIGERDPRVIPWAELVALHREWEAEPKDER